MNNPLAEWRWAHTFGITDSFLGENCSFEILSYLKWPWEAQPYTSLCNAHNHPFVHPLCIIDFLISGFLCHNTKASQGRGNNWLGLRWGGEMDEIKPGTPTGLEEHPLRIREASPPGWVGRTAISVTTAPTTSISEHTPISRTSCPGLFPWITESPWAGTFTTAQRHTTQTVPSGVWLWCFLLP